jgi:glycine/D-amino acid oxidase-like deaminating enzyme
MNSNGKVADFVVIGAGVMGSSIAYHLAARKAGRIILLDKDHVGRGASGRSSALIRMHYTFAPEVQLALKSLEMFRNWTEITGAPGDFRRTGFVQVVPENDFGLLKKNVEMQRRLGVNVEILSVDELHEMEPDWYLDDGVAAAYEPDSGYGDGAGVANDFLAKARELGVQYRPRTRVTDLLIQRSRVTGIATDHGEIEAPVVIAATGQWSKDLFTRAHIDVPIQTEYHEVAILKNPPGMKPGGCACIDYILSVYFRSEGHDKTLVGAFTGDRDIDPENFPQKASQESLAALAEIACKRIPCLENAALVRGITGVYDLTPDYRALLGEIPEVHGLYIAAGFSGMGFKISPAIGLVMSELILDGRARTVDISAFRVSRFAEGQPIRPEFEYAER